MYLKSLVLKGFKSFADRSALTLEPGITAVVGPNGSGKSNISDAVLWVLGERNAKNLRGQAMEDVIFAGSSARKASGLAEVDLVLDNSDGTLPVDFDEVAITRRMYRNGESEYLINGTVARRMDVLDILHDSGLGTGTHSIISQGSLDSILQSKPEDRRALIEEAAGVLKHKQRKAKSERKLANMDQHLLRARDVVGEVARQLGPLERKAKKARTYQELAAQQAEMSLTIAVDDLRGLQKEWDAAKAREAALAAELEERRGAIEEAEAAVEALQERIRQQTLDAGDLSRRHRAAATAVERFDSAAMMLRERRRAATARAGELELSIEANAVKADEAASELARATAQYEEAAGELDAAKRRYRTWMRSTAIWECAAGAGTRAFRPFQGRREDDRRARDGASPPCREHRGALPRPRPRAGGGGARRRAGARARTRSRGGRARAGRGRRGRWRALRAVADESAARAAVGTAVQSRDAARAAIDEARDTHRALSVEIATLEEMERASASVLARPARGWSSTSMSVPAAFRPLSHVIWPAGLRALVEIASRHRRGHAARGETRAWYASGGQLGGRRGARARRPSCCATTPRAGPDPGAAVARRPGRHRGRARRRACLPVRRRGAVEALLGDVVVCATLDMALSAHGGPTGSACASSPRRMRSCGPRAR